jgi:hypothetical protein
MVHDFLSRLRADIEALERTKDDLIWRCVGACSWERSIKSVRSEIKIRARARGTPVPDVFRTMLDDEDDRRRAHEPCVRHAFDQKAAVIVGNSIRLASEVESGDALG